MALSEITSPDAVLAAIHEFDDLGREKFLHKYGFGHSRIYTLERDGKEYDSKAIIGATHAFQFPEKGPLKHDEFSGGEATVRKKLEELGFHVTMKSLSSDLTFSEIMAEVLDLQQSWTKDNTPEMERRGQLIRDLGPKALSVLLPPRSVLSFSPAIEGRDGTGLKTRVPWIRIFDKSRSPSATSGWYVVFLFARDGHAVYLSLNQGTTTINHGTYVRRSPSFLNEQVAWAREQLNHLIEIDRALTDIELKDSGGLGDQYEKGNVIAFRYMRNDLPDISLLKTDLETMLKLLDELYSMKSSASVPTPKYDINLPQQVEVTIIQPEDEDKFANTSAAISCKVDEFNSLLNFFLDFANASRLDIDLSTSVDVLATVLSSQFLLFAGPSGTGKSSLARVLARFFTLDEAWHILEARRQWIGPEDVFGYYSPLTGYYALTPSTTDLIKLHQISLKWYHSRTDTDLNDIAVPILLIEEANLSPIEGYLAPIIHGISSPSASYVKVPLHAKPSGATDTENSIIVPCDVLLGPYPRFFGTINVDPTSHAPARKVSTRASVVLLEPEENFDPTAAALFLSTIGTTSTFSETLPTAPPGRQWIGDPAAARVVCNEKELREFTDTLASFLRAVVDENNEAILRLSHRDLERCVNYMAYFIRLGNATSGPTPDRPSLLRLAAENAMLHIVLPNLPANIFRICVQALLEDEILSTPSYNPRQLGGLLLPRLQRLYNSTTGIVFTEALDFWACLT
jgi:energy-coupling factor transporter ATP-binding protein EcfA2